MPLRLLRSWLFARREFSGSTNRNGKLDDGPGVELFGIRPGTAFA